jgi:hypothetical protein
LGNKYSPYPGDIVPAKLEPGEFVMNRNAVKDIGVENLKAANDASPRYPQEMQKGGFMDKENRQRQYDADRKYRRDMEIRDAALTRSGSMRDARLEKASRMSLGISSPELRRPVTHIDLQAIKTIPMNPEFNIDEWNGMLGPMSQNLRNYQTAYDEKQRQRITIHKNMFQNVPRTQSEIDTGNRTSQIMRNAEQNDKMLKHEMAVKSESGRRNDAQARMQSQQGSREIVKAMQEQAYLAEMQDPGVGPKMKYGPNTIRGIDPRTWKPPKNAKSWTPAEQLMEQMNQKRNKKYNTYIKEDNPAIKKVLKDNPLMELERLNRKDNLQQWSDDRTQKIKDDVALEYSPQNLWNADIRDELIGDPNDPSDDYGSSLADAKKRSADRNRWESNYKALEMMHPGKGPKYVTKKGGYGATREEWVKEQRESGARHKERMADQRMSDDGLLRLGSQKEFDDWRPPAPTKVTQKLPKPAKGSLRSALSKFKQDFAVGLNDDLLASYQKEGGLIRGYALGDFVTAGKEMFGAGVRGVQNIGRGIASGAGAVVDRYDAGHQASRAMDVQRDFTDAQGDRLSDEESAMLRDEYDIGESDLGMTVAAGGKQLGRDTLSVGAGALGAVGAGVVGTGKLAKAGYKGAKGWMDAGGWNQNAAEAGKDILGDDGEVITKGKSAAERVWSGEAKGSLKQRGQKGLGLLGGLLQDASTAQGFKGAPEGYYDDFGFNKNKKLGASPDDTGGPLKEGIRPDTGMPSDDAEMLDDINMKDSNKEMDDMMNDAFGNEPLQPDGTKALETSESMFGPQGSGVNNALTSEQITTALNENTGDPTEDARNVALNQQRANTQFKTSTGHIVTQQRGGFISMDGFIRQSWRNL